jgi:phosphoserine phosphatase
MNIILCRHGETPWNKEGRYQGHTDIPLSADGEAQAQALGRRLANMQIDRAVASPLSRARRTAELGLGTRAAILSTDPDLIEISHGEWEGLLSTEIEAAHPEMLARWRSDPDADVAAGPGAETLAQVTLRAWSALQRATVNLEKDQTLLLVAHDAVNRALLCKIMGLPLSRVWSFQQTPATINALRGDDVNHLQVLRLNDASHHAALFEGAAHKAL